MDNFKWDEQTAIEFAAYYSLKSADEKEFKLYKHLKDFKESKQPKPLFKTEDGVDIFSNYKNDIWRVFTEPSSYKQWHPVLLGLPEFIHLGQKYFSTKEAAEQYILENKPCLSLKDVLSIPCGYTCDIRSELTKLVQSKLKS